MADFNSFKDLSSAFQLKSALLESDRRSAFGVRDDSPLEKTKVAADSLAQKSEEKEVAVPIEKNTTQNIKQPTHKTIFKKKKLFVVFMGVFLVFAIIYLINKIF
ncbi:hypothetical protein GYA49_00900 [Candidatus Beckwithbacteria bacterium]|nr:hypothetical protein [Candidatus Beckwithbacteria bacterium]